MVKKIIAAVFCCLFLLSLTSGLVPGMSKPVQGAYFDQDGVIRSDEVIDDDVFLGGNQVIMDGTIHGFLVSSGQTILINGTINGDAILAANTIQIGEEAKITGNLFFACQNAVLKGAVEGSVAGASLSLVAGGQGTIRRNLYYGGYSLEIQPHITTGRDVYAGVYQAILSGNIARNVKLSAGAVDLSGEVGGDVTANFGETTSTTYQQPPAFFFPGMNFEMPKTISPGLRVSPEAKIGGKLTYTASSELQAAIQSRPGDGVVYQTPVPNEGKEIEKGTDKKIRGSVVTPFEKWGLQTLRNLVTFLILGGLAVWLIPELLKRLMAIAREKPAPSAGHGFVVLVITYAAAAFTTLVVLLLWIFLLVVKLGGLGGTVFALGFSSIALIMAAFGFLVSYGSKLIIACLAGNWILRLLSPGSEPARGWAMVVGVVLYVLLRGIPVFGWLIGMAATLIGIGAAWLLYREWRQPRNVPATAAILHPGEG